MKLPYRFYTVSDFQKKRLGILYIARPCTLADQGADQLQTICDPAFGFLPIRSEALR